MQLSALFFENLLSSRAVSSTAADLFPPFQTPTLSGESPSVSLQLQPLPFLFFLFAAPEY